MDKILISLIFLVLGINLYRNKKKAVQKFYKAQSGAVVLSENKEASLYRMQQKAMMVCFCLIIIYLLLGLVIKLNQTPVLVLIVLFMGLYYWGIFLVNDEWFFDQEGLWSTHQARPIGYENIVSYEWREYGQQFVIRVRYKGRGIMLTTSDFLVRPMQKEEVSELLNTHMAGM